MTTGVVKPGSDLERRAWMREGLVQSASKSFWNKYTGNTKDAIVFQAKNESAKSGHTVVFDFDGNLSGKAVKGKNTARGKGEQKRKFSDKLTVERYRLVVDNGDKFDGVNIGDLTINEHSDSRSKLSDLFVRFKDQALFDAAQGLLVTETDEAIQQPTHTIEFGADFGYDQLIDLEVTLRTSRGFTKGGIRRPLVPFNMNEENPVWLVILDSMTTAKLRKDQRWTSIVPVADTRGSGNMALSGQIKRIGALLIQEAPLFFGETAGDGAGWGLNDSKIEMSGLRQYDKTNDAWTGQAGFDYASEIWSRNLVLGAGGLQIAFGKQPEYHWKSSDDFDITSESCLEVWMETRKTILKQESGDAYKMAKVSDIDHGVIALDIKVSA